MQQVTCSNKKTGQIDPDCEGTDPCLNKGGDIRLRRIRSLENLKLLKIVTNLKNCPDFASRLLQLSRPGRFLPVTDNLPCLSPKSFETSDDGIVQKKVLTSSVYRSTYYVPQAPDDDLTRTQSFDSPSSLSPSGSWHSLESISSGDWASFPETSLSDLNIASSAQSLKSPVFFDTIDSDEDEIWVDTESVMKPRKCVLLEKLGSENGKHTAVDNKKAEEVDNDLLHHKCMFKNALVFVKKGGETRNAEEFHNGKYPRDPVNKASLGVCSTGLDDSKLSFVDTHNQEQLARVRNNPTIHDTPVKNDTESSFVEGTLTIVRKDSIVSSCVVSLNTSNLEAEHSRGDGQFHHDNLDHQTAVGITKEIPFVNESRSPVLSRKCLNQGYSGPNSFANEEILKHSQDSHVPNSDKKERVQESSNTSVSRSSTNKPVIIERKANSCRAKPKTKDNTGVSTEKETPEFRFSRRYPFLAEKIKADPVYQELDLSMMKLHAIPATGECEISENKSHIREGWEKVDTNNPKSASVNDNVGTETHRDDAVAENIKVSHKDPKINKVRVENVFTQGRNNTKQKCSSLREEKRNGACSNKKDSETKPNSHSNTHAGSTISRTGEDKIRTGRQRKKKKSKERKQKDDTDFFIRWDLLEGTVKKKKKQQPRDFHIWWHILEGTLRDYDSQPLVRSTRAGKCKTSDEQGLKKELKVDVEQSPYRLKNRIQSFTSKNPSGTRSLYTNEYENKSLDKGSVKVFDTEDDALAAYSRSDDKTLKQNNLGTCLRRRSRWHADSLLDAIDLTCSSGKEKETEGIDSLGDQLLNKSETLKVDHSRIVDPLRKTRHRNVLDSITSDKEDKNDVLELNKQINEELLNKGNERKSLREDVFEVDTGLPRSYGDYSVPRSTTIAKSTGQVFADLKKTSERKKILQPSHNLYSTLLDEKDRRNHSSKQANSTPSKREIRNKRTLELVVSQCALKGKRCCSEPSDKNSSSGDSIGERKNQQSDVKSSIPTLCTATATSAGTASNIDTSGLSENIFLSLTRCIQNATFSRQTEVTGDREISGRKTELTKTKLSPKKTPLDTLDMCEILASSPRASLRTMTSLQKQVNFKTDPSISAVLNKTIPQVIFTPVDTSDMIDVPEVIASSPRKSLRLSLESTLHVVSKKNEYVMDIVPRSLPSVSPNPTEKITAIDSKDSVIASSPRMSLRISKCHYWKNATTLASQTNENQASISLRRRRTGSSEVTETNLPPKESDITVIASSPSIALRMSHRKIEPNGTSNSNVLEGVTVLGPNLHESGTSGPNLPDADSIIPAESDSSVIASSPSAGLRVSNSFYTQNVNTHDEMLDALSTHKLEKKARNNVSPKRNRFQDAENIFPDGCSPDVTLKFPKNRTLEEETNGRTEKYAETTASTLLPSMGNHSNEDNLLAKAIQTNQNSKEQSISKYGPSKEICRSVIASSPSVAIRLSRKFISNDKSNFALDSNETARKETFTAPINTEALGRKNKLNSDKEIASVIASSPNIALKMVNNLRASEGKLVHDQTDFRDLYEGENAKTSTPVSPSPFTLRGKSANSSKSTEILDNTETDAAQQDTLIADRAKGDVRGKSHIFRSPTVHEDLSSNKKIRLEVVTKVNISSITFTEADETTIHTGLQHPTKEVQDSETAIEDGEIYEIGGSSSKLSSRSSVHSIASQTDTFLSNLEKAMEVFKDDSSVLPKESNKSGIPLIESPESDNEREFNLTERDRTPMITHSLFNVEENISNRTDKMASTTDRSKVRKQRLRKSRIPIRKNTSIQSPADYPVQLNMLQESLEASTVTPKGTVDITLDDNLQTKEIAAFYDLEELYGCPKSKQKPEESFREIANSERNYIQTPHSYTVFAVQQQSSDHRKIKRSSAAEASRDALNKCTTSKAERTNSTVGGLWKTLATKAAERNMSFVERQECQGTSRGNRPALDRPAAESKPPVVRNISLMQRQNRESAEHSPKLQRRYSDLVRLCSSMFFPQSPRCKKHETFADAFKAIRKMSPKTNNLIAKDADLKENKLKSFLNDQLSGRPEISCDKKKQEATNNTEKQPLSDKQIQRILSTASEQLQRKMTLPETRLAERFLRLSSSSGSRRFKDEKAAEKHYSCITAILLQILDRNKQDVFFDAKDEEWNGNSNEPSHQEKTKLRDNTITKNTRVESADRIQYKTANARHTATIRQPGQGKITGKVKQVTKFPSPRSRNLASPDKFSAMTQARRQENSPGKVDQATKSPRNPTSPDEFSSHKEHRRKKRRSVKEAVQFYDCISSDSNESIPQYRRLVTLVREYENETDPNQKAPHRKCSFVLQECDSDQQNLNPTEVIPYTIEEKGEEELRNLPDEYTTQHTGVSRLEKGPENQLQHSLPLGSDNRFELKESPEVIKDCNVACDTSFPSGEVNTANALQLTSYTPREKSKERDKGNPVRKNELVLPAKCAPSNEMQQFQGSRSDRLEVALVETIVDDEHETEEENQRHLVQMNDQSDPILSRLGQSEILEPETLAIKQLLLRQDILSKLKFSIMRKQKMPTKKEIIDSLCSKNDLSRQVKTKCEIQDTNEEKSDVGQYAEGQVVPYNSPTVANKGHSVSTSGPHVEDTTNKNGVTCTTNPDVSEAFVDITKTKCQRADVGRNLNETTDASSFRHQSSRTEHVVLEGSAKTICKGKYNEHVDAVVELTPANQNKTTKSGAELILKSHNQTPKSGAELTLTSENNTPKSRAELTLKNQSKTIKSGAELTLTNQNKTTKSGAKLTLTNQNKTTKSGTELTLTNQNKTTKSEESPTDDNGAGNLQADKVLQPALLVSKTEGGVSLFKMDSTGQKQKCCSSSPAQVVGILQTGEEKYFRDAISEKKHSETEGALSDKTFIPTQRKKTVTWATNVINNETEHSRQEDPLKQKKRRENSRFKIPIDAFALRSRDKLADIAFGTARATGNKLPPWEYADALESLEAIGNSKFNLENKDRIDKDLYGDWEEESRSVASNDPTGTDKPNRLMEKHKLQKVPQNDRVHRDENKSDLRNYYKEEPYSDDMYNSMINFFECNDEFVDKAKDSPVRSLQDQAGGGKRPEGKTTEKRHKGNTLEARGRSLLQDIQRTLKLSKTEKEKK